MVTTFNAKFFFAEVQYTLAELGQPPQYVGEDLDAYIKRFHDKAHDCIVLVLEEVLVNVCLHGMDDEYKVSLENLTFLSFSKLMEAARRTNKSVRRAPKPSRAFSIMRSFAKRKQTGIAVEGDQKAESSGQKRPTQMLEKREFKQERKAYPPLPPLPCNVKKSAAFC